MKAIEEIKNQKQIHENQALNKEKKGREKGMIFLYTRVKPPWTPAFRCIAQKAYHAKG